MIKLIALDLDDTLLMPDCTIPDEAVAVLKQPLFFRGINLPIYFKYVCGNVVDVSTLTRTMKELKAYNIDTKFAVLDAGYLYC